MADASLPDRVKAWALVIDDVQERARRRGDTATPHEIARALAAADACEAERNPNPTDEYEQIGWRDTFNGHLARRREYADEPPRWEPIYRKRKRRAVSSEDVHREVDE